MNYVALIQACERAWKDIQMYNPEVPNAIVVVASAGAKSKNLLGQFANEVWTDASDESKAIHEVLIVAEQLHRGSEEVFHTLLHESVHALAYARKIKDTTGRRHNKRFARLAEELGLEPPERPNKLGFSDCTMPESTAYIYKRAIEDIGNALTMCRTLKLVQKETQKTSWAAECECGVKIRVGKKVYNEKSNDPTLKIVCTECDSNFEVSE